MNGTGFNSVIFWLIAASNKTFDLRELITSSLTEQENKIREKITERVRNSLQRSKSLIYNDAQISITQEHPTPPTGTHNHPPTLPPQLLPN